MAEQRLVAARNYWLSTASAAAVPHAMPVWGVWLGDRFLFSTGPRTRKARNLVSNARAVVHLESGAQLVVVEGVARQVSDATVVDSFVSAYNPKYDWSFTVADLSSGELFEVRPLKAFTWLGDEGADFSAAGTRWVFEDPPLQAPRKQRKRRRLGHSENGIARRRPEFPNHVWSYDFISDQLEDGRRVKIFERIDEYTRRTLVLRTARSFTSTDVIEDLERLSSSTASPSTFARTTGASSSPTPSALGWRSTRWGRCKSHQAVPGRTVTWRASTAGTATSSSTGRCSRATSRPMCCWRSSRKSTTSVARTAHWATSRPSASRRAGTAVHRRGTRLCTHSGSWEEGIFPAPFNPDRHSGWYENRGEVNRRACAVR